MKNQIIISLFLLATLCAAPVFAQESSNLENECKMYIETGFVGTSVSFEFSETDIRYVLDYFAKQFGCEFVLDELVGYVPITVKIKNVPWINALKNILQSQDLDLIFKKETDKIIDAENLSLFISTKEKIRSEYERLNPLYNKIIKLKNLPTCPNDTKCEQTSTALNGLKKIVSRRLSRRGIIEYDERTQTLIITDERANLDASVRVVEFIDNSDFYNKIEEDK